MMDLLAVRMADYRFPARQQDQQGIRPLAAEEDAASVT